MNSLLNQTSRGDISARLARLEVGTAATWGSFDPPSMLSHLLRAFEISFAEHDIEFKPSFFSTAFGKWLVFKSPMPWGKGLEAPPVFFERPPGSDFDAEKQLAQDYLGRFCSPESESWGKSPVFGPLSSSEWGLLHYRHCDHHLRQFGL